MTTADFDPRNLDLYQEPRHLLHFQFGKSSNVCLHNRAFLLSSVNAEIVDAPNKFKAELQISTTDAIMN